MFPYSARPPLTAQPFLLHHHSALEMSKRLPAKWFYCPRSDFLHRERQSAKSADHSVTGTKLKMDWCHKSWQMQETLTLFLWVLHPWALLPCSRDVPRGLLQISAQTPPEAASAGHSLCPGMGLRKSLQEEKKNITEKKKSNQTRRRQVDSFRSFFDRLGQKRDFPIQTRFKQHCALPLQAA